MAAAANIVELIPAAPLEPLSSPVMHLDDGTAWVPSAFSAGAYENLPVCAGIGVGWTPVPDTDKILIIFAGGNPAAPTREMVVAAISRAGLRRLVRDLRSIDAQLEDE